MSRSSRVVDALRRPLASLATRRQVAHTDEAQSTLLLAVSETGWHGTILHKDGRTPEHLGDAAASLDTPATTLSVLQRAIRSIAPAQRAEIARVHLLVADTETALADNRFTRIRSTAADSLGEAGAHILGCTGAIGGFLRFGRSSDHETPRGVHIFVGNTRVSQWLGALDSLAVRLVELLSAEALLLTSNIDAPVLAIDVGSTGTTALMVDPESGAVALRHLPVGVLTFAAALHEASAIPLKDALAGLERRNCLPVQGSRSTLPTATDRAIAPILARLDTDLRELADYFVFQRLAAAPERVVVSGEAHRIRGLIEWLAHATDLPAEEVPGPGQRFIAQESAARERLPVTNLLNGLPSGMLRIGRVGYSFRDGQFRPDQVDASRARLGGGSPNLFNRKIELAPILARLRPSLPSLKFRPILLRPSLHSSVVPGLACAALFVSIGVAVANLETNAASAAEIVMEAVQEEGAARKAFHTAQTAPKSDSSTGVPVLTEKLLALAAALPHSVWLTRLGIPPESAARTGQLRLVLEGVAHEAGSDPVEPVTTLMARLSADAAFMQGVTRVALDGVTAERDGLRFVITVFIDSVTRPSGPTVPQ